MGSGESDVRNIVIKGLDVPSNNLTNTISDTFSSFTWPTSTYWYNQPTVYMYQIMCPKRGCKTLNWCQIDHIISCTKCDSKLRAVSNTVDFEIPVG